jgi:molybdenum cofactor cytidylyltransferase
LGQPETNRRLFAVIPAGGLSRRMGRPKLLLPLGGKTVIRRVLETLNAAGVSVVYVLIREDDEPLRAEVSQTDATIVTTPSPTPDMRRSVELLLKSIEEDHQPGPRDGWLLCPADHPVLDADVVKQLVRAWRDSGRGIVVPVHNGRRGHPTILNWRYAELVGEIPPDRGINWLLASNPGDIHEEPVESSGILTDLDTPADYDLLKSSRSPIPARICGPETG